MSWVCLMYHDLLPETDAHGGGPERFAVPVSEFERTLDLIIDEGRRGCSLDAAIQRADWRSVAITFDDGGASQYEWAVPALRARGMTATFFVTTDWVGTRGFMTWPQLRELVEWGMSVQSHTRSHQLLSELDADRLREELFASKAILDEELGQDTDQISLPGGNAPRPGLRSMLGEAGYRVVACSRWGSNKGGLDSNGMRHAWVRRCTMRGRMEEARIRAVLGGDPGLAWRRATRETLLNGLRAALGANRYHRWRRRFLDTVSSGKAAKG